MKIILLDNIASLGRKGDIKHVSDGYATNYLFPQGKAAPATAQNLNNHIGQTKDEDLKLKEQENYYNKIKRTLDRSTINFSAKVSENNILYQGISIATIVDAISERYSFDLKSNWFHGTRILKEIGRHRLNINLPNGQKFSIYINIKSL